jgi:hypothetical protein
LSPKVNGETHHFYLAGVYNGLFFLGDRESGSYWEHMTGECIHGPLRGQQLRYVGSLQHMTALEAITEKPTLEMATPKSGLRTRLFSMTLWPRLRMDKRPEGMLPPHFPASMGEEDPRLERMTVGLGVWGEAGPRFYPLTEIQENGGAILDELSGGRQRLVLVDPLTGAPVAFSVNADEIRRADGAYELVTKSGDTLVFRDGAFYDAFDSVLDVPSPPQLLTRWYGFSFTFPKCSIYGQT